MGESARETYWHRLSICRHFIPYAQQCCGIIFTRSIHWISRSKTVTSYPQNISTTSHLSTLTDQQYKREDKLVEVGDKQTSSNTKTKTNMNTSTHRANEWRWLPEDAQPTAGGKKNNVIWSDCHQVWQMDPGALNSSWLGVWNKSTAPEHLSL